MSAIRCSPPVMLDAAVLTALAVAAAALVGVTTPADAVGQTAVAS